MKLVTRKIPSTLFKRAMIVFAMPLVLQMAGCARQNPCAYDQTYFNGSCIPKPPAVVAQEQEWLRQQQEAEARRLESYRDPYRGGGGYGLGQYMQGYVPRLNINRSGHGFHTHGHMKFYGGDTYTYD